MKQAMRFGGMALALICLLGCIQVNTVVKLKPDGSGSVEETLFVTKASMQGLQAMMKEMGGMLPEEGVSAENFNLLDEARLREIADHMGEGVSYVSGEKTTTDEGEGYRATYAFSDVNKLRLNMNPCDKAPSGLGGAASVSVGKEAFVTFRFVKGPPAILRVTMPEDMSTENLQPPKVMERLNADDAQAAMVADKVKEVSRGTKVSISLEVEGDIVRTNATHRQGSRITLMEVDLGKLFEDRENLKKLSQRKPKNLKDAEKLLKDLPGIKVELNPELTIEFAGIQPMDSIYWLKKGAICYIYGNPKGAITYFKKAIELDPTSASAYFNQGICKGELGQYGEAIACINKAIDIYPEKGLYFYGRAMVHLLSGHKDKAIEDFRHAAELGDRDAQTYLQDPLHGEPMEMKFEESIIRP
jgi:hypothetical protein